MYYYKRIQGGKTVSVEAKSIGSLSPHFVRATKAEYDAFIAKLPAPLPPSPARNFGQEIDGLVIQLREVSEKIEELLAK